MVRNYDFIYMIMNNLTMNWFWYPANRCYSLVLWYLANRSYSLVLWYPNQWRLFIGTLISKPMEVIHWYSDAQCDHSHKIVKKMKYGWIFELFWVLKTTYVILEMFEYLNYFESLKLLMFFLEPIVSYSFWYMEN